MNFDSDALWQVIKKYGKTVKDFERKEAFDETIRFVDFIPENKCSPEKYYNSFELERIHYGFSWQHQLEKCPEYLGEYGFSQFQDNDAIITAGVEVVLF